MENEISEDGYDLLYGEGVFRFDTEGFLCLDDDTQAYLNECWDSLKIQDQGVGVVLPVLCLSLAGLIAAGLIGLALRKRRRARYWN